MIAFEEIFDAGGRRRPPLGRLAGEALGIVPHFGAWPSPSELPDGGGRAVLVVPAFLTNDLITIRLRRFLGRCGFRPYGWGVGINYGPTAHALSGLERRLNRLMERYGTVALVGISLGGLLARNLAYERPGDIAHVVTVASPFMLPTASTMEAIVRVCGRRYSPAVQPRRLLTPLPVPSTMIYTEDDGIVAPDSCWTAEGGEVLGLRGPHLRLATHPEALRLMVRRMAPAAGEAVGTPGS